MNPLKELILNMQMRLCCLDLRSRLYMYIAVLVTILSSCICLLVIFIDIFTFPKDAIRNELEKGLNAYKSNLSSYFSNTAAHGIRFSKISVYEIEKLLEKKEISFSKIANNSVIIDTLQKNIYDLLYRSMILANCSGAFIIFDTTINTRLPDAADSRSGMYLKLQNLRTPTPENYEMFWVRGIAHIGTENGHFFHNKWELEFSLKKLPFYRHLKNIHPSHSEDVYFVTPRIKLPGTWESMVFLCVPLVGSNGEFYGICGFEISTMYFKLAHKAGNGDDECVTGLVAHRQQQWLLPATGLESGSASGYYAGLDDTPLRVESLSRGLNRYVSSNRVFIGVESPITLSPQPFGENWSVAYFIPESTYTARLNECYIKTALACTIFILVALAVSYLLTKRYVTPLLNGIEAAKKGAAMQTNIVEIDELISHLSQKDKVNAATAEADMSGFYQFRENIKKLSQAERLVFDLYLKDYSAQKIADTLFISIHTVKSHNRNIYAKLGVSSRKELMLYIRMLKGHCGEERTAGQE